MSKPPTLKDEIFAQLRGREREHFSEAYVPWAVEGEL